MYYFQIQKHVAFQAFNFLLYTIDAFTVRAYTTRKIVKCIWYMNLGWYKILDINEIHVGSSNLNTSLV